MDGPSFCTRCGVPRRTGSAFCTSCGASFARAPTSTPGSPTGDATTLPSSSIARASTAQTQAAGTMVAGGSTSAAAAATGVGLAGKIALAVLAVAVLGAGAVWVASTQEPQNTRSIPAVGSDPAARPDFAVPTAAPELTIVGPAEVPYGEPAVFTVTATNPTTAHTTIYGPMGYFSDEGAPDARRTMSWSPAGKETSQGKNAWLTPGSSFTWTVTVANTRYSIGEFSVSVDPTYGIWAYPDGLWCFDDDCTYETSGATASISIVTPIRALATHWDDYCEMMKAIYATETRAEQIWQCLTFRGDDDPSCPKPLEDDDRRALESERDQLSARLTELEAERLSYIDEGEAFDRRFLHYGDQAACDCWCAYRPEIVCRTVDPGTKADVQEE